MIRHLAATTLALALLGGCGEATGDSGNVSGAAEEPSSPVASSPAPPSPSTTATPSEPSTPAPPTGPRRVTAYYLGDGPRGPALFREERPVFEPDHGPAESIGLLTAKPLDPDYRTVWPVDAFLGGLVNLDDGTIDVLLADTTLLDRPPALSEAEAEASIQQVVYTLQAYADRPLPVRFLLDDQPVGTVLGVPTSAPVAAGPVLTTLSLMS